MWAGRYASRFHGVTKMFEVMKKKEKTYEVTIKDVVIHLGDIKYFTTAKSKAHLEKLMQKGDSYLLNDMQYAVNERVVDGVRNLHYGHNVTIDRVKGVQSK